MVPEWRINIKWIKSHKKEMVIDRRRIKMLNPNFRYTNNIVRLLTKISASREIILNSPLIYTSRENLKVSEEIKKNGP